MLCVLVCVKDLSSSASCHHLPDAFICLAAFVRCTGETLVVFVLPSTALIIEAGITQPLSLPTVGLPTPLLRRTSPRFLYFWSKAHPAARAVWGSKKFNGW